MLIDRYNQFAKALSIVGTAASAIPTDVINLGAAGDAWGREGEFLHIRIDTLVAASGGAANVTFKLQTSVDEAFTSPIDLWTSGAIAKGTLVAKYFVTGRGVPLPKGVKQYLRVTATPDTNDTTGGKIDAFLSPDVQANLFKTSAVGQG
jgi:hypothetical protein